MEQCPEQLQPANYRKPFLKLPLFFGNLLVIFPVTKFLFHQNLVTIGLGEGVGVAEMVVNGSRGFKITGSGMSRGTAPSITLRHLLLERLAAIARIL